MGFFQVRWHILMNRHQKHAEPFAHLEGNTLVRLYPTFSLSFLVIYFAHPSCMDYVFCRQITKVLQLSFSLPFTFFGFLLSFRNLFFSEFRSSHFLYSFASLLIMQSLLNRNLWSQFISLLR